MNTLRTDTGPRLREVDAQAPTLCNHRRFTKLNKRRDVSDSRMNGLRQILKAVDEGSSIFSAFVRIIFVEPDENAVSANEESVSRAEGENDSVAERHDSGF